MAQRRAFYVQLDYGAGTSFSYHIGLWRRVRVEVKHRQIKHVRESVHGADMAILVNIIIQMFWQRHRLLTV